MNKVMKGKVHLCKKGIPIKSKVLSQMGEELQSGIRGC